MPKLKDALLELGVHQGEFGTLVGVSRVTVGSWCNGKSNPSKWTSPGVARTLGILQGAHLSGALADLAGLTSAAERLEFLQGILDAASD